MEAGMFVEEKAFLFRVNLEASFPEDYDGDGPQPPVQIYRGAPAQWDRWVGGFGN
jgi:hypothetical protein